jgi:hypothetical protein
MLKDQRAPATDRIDGEVRFLSREEGRALFDQRARDLLGISGDEFLRRWDAGEYDAVADDPDHPEIMDLVMLRSFGR